LRYGIIADIHSNLEALRTVLDILERENIDKFLCLGDIVGYGANPNECVEKVRNLEAEVVVGNHEWGVLHQEIRSFFNPVAKQAIEWTERELSTENQDYLAHMAVVKETNLFLMFHSTLYEPTQWYYIISPKEAEQNFFLMKREIGFFAHSHQAVIYFKPQDENCKGFALPEGGKMLLEKGYRYLINPGSVGQPRDGNPQASFGIYDTKSRTVQIKRCDYDVNRAREKILKAGLPPFLGERLLYGI